MDEKTIAENMKLFDFLRTPDPKHTKKFQRGGGFSGTAINATWVASRLTAAFGPAGCGWGVDVEDERYVEGHVIDERDNRTIIHVLRVRLWWLQAATGRKGEIIAYGQTTFVGQTKNGVFTDEEAPKKSLTDAMTKAASWLGVAADIHMGLFDDVKYVAQADRVWASEREETPGAVVRTDEASLRARWDNWKKLAEQGTTVEALRTLRPGLVDIVNQAKAGGFSGLVDEMAADYNQRLTRFAEPG